MKKLEECRTYQELEDTVKAIQAKIEKIKQCKAYQELEDQVERESD